MRNAGPRSSLATLALRSVVALSCLACTRTDSSSAPAPAAGGIIAAAAAATSPAPPAAPSPTVRFVGRFDTSNPAAPRFAWSGSAIVARFQGTGIAARIKDDGKNQFQIFVDGEPKAILKTEPTKDTYTLADGLSDGPHEVILYKRTEARVGEAAFLGFEPKGRMLPAPPSAERRIEFIGDSITTGYGVEGPGSSCYFTPDTQNELATYAGITARALGADHHTIAWSGKTIMEMTEMWDRTLPANPESKWDFKAWTPHVVVINLGTNNFALQDPGEERYVRLYTALVDRVRKAYPEAFIVCMLGPMLTDVYPEGHRSLTQARKYMRNAVAKIKTSGDTNVELLEVPEQKHSDGLGCGFHPSQKTQKIVAERLVALVREKLRW
jgi:lysophospholipase L1-like esterase